MFHLFHLFHLFRPYFTRVSGERCSYSVAQDEKAEHMEHMEHMFLYIKIFFVCQDSGEPYNSGVTMFDVLRMYNSIFISIRK